MVGYLILLFVWAGGGLVGCRGTIRLRRSFPVGMRRERRSRCRDVVLPLAVRRGLKRLKTVYQEDYYKLGGESYRLFAISSGHGRTGHAAVKPVFTIFTPK